MHSTKVLNNIKVSEVPVELYYASIKEDKRVPYEIHRQFTFNDVTYSNGDYVIINGESHKEICHIFSIFVGPKKIVQLVVRKYIFAKHLRKLLLKEACTNFEDYEVVEDCTRDYVIDANDIIKKCFLKVTVGNESFDRIEETSLDDTSYFLCRYKLKLDELYPILNASSTILSENNMRSPFSMLSPATKLRCSLGSENVITCAKEESPRNFYKNMKTPTNDSFSSPVQRNSVRRNLNESFGTCLGETNDSILNYSVANDEDLENSLILKLKISGNSKSPRVLLDRLNKTSSPKEIIEKEIAPIRKSTRKVQRKSYADYVSPVKNTPKKRAKSSDSVEHDEESLENSNSIKLSANKKLGTPKKLRIPEEVVELKKRTIRTPKRYDDDWTPQVSSNNRSSARRSLRLMPGEANLDVTPRRAKREKSLSLDIDEESNYKRTSQRKINLDESFRRSILKIKLNKSDLEEYVSPSSDTKNKFRNEDYTSSDDNSESTKPVRKSVRTPRKSARRLSILQNDKSPVPKTPKTNKNTTSRKSLRETPRSSVKQTPKTLRNTAKLIRDGVITPSMQCRSKVIGGDSTPLMRARSQLHVSYVPNALPCREREYCDVYNFLEGKLLDGCGGCMYISGVPGTGKTATVSSVISNLQQTKHILNFNYVSVNGMRLTEPRQSYVEILKQLTGKTVPWEQAQSILEEKFTKAVKMPPTVMLIDELDILCTKRQDVVYNLLDWPTKSRNQLIVITIANTMDLPERLLMSRVTSRLGLTRLTFQAYTHKQLQEIVTKRLSGTECFNPDAIQFVARKVASVSGDARRALDICRRAAEIAESENDNQLVNMSHVNEALNAMITQPKVRAIKNCARLEQLILQSIVAEVERTGVEETTFSDVYKMLVSCAAIEGFKMVSITVALSAVARLSACRLILSDPKCNDISQKIILNVSIDDVYYALKKDQT